MGTVSNDDVNVLYLCCSDGHLECFLVQVVYHTQMTFVVARLLRNCGITTLSVLKQWYALISL